MRLTLRTLLAYMDDILDPAHTKEMGVRINESPAATNLIARIRDVLRRRRLTAPDLEGPGAGLDPNTVAEYLDNTLPAESVADVERVCLESDIHLAEVAASHQILTLVLGEPVDVVPQSRERMYALGPMIGAGDQVGTVAAGTVASGETGNGSPTAALREAPRGPQTAAAATSFSESIPDYLKPRPLWKRLLPYAVVVALVALFVGLLATDPAFNLFTHSEPRSTQVAEGDAAPKEVLPAASTDPLLPDDRNDTDVPVVAVDAAVPAAAPREAVEMPLDPPPPPDEPAAGAVVVGDQPPVPVRLPADAPAGAEKPAAPDKVAVNVPQPQPAPKMELPAKEEPVAPPAAAPAPAGPPVEYVSAEGILLRQDADDGQWYVLPRRSLVHAGERFASPEPYDSVLSVGRGRYQVTFQGGSAGRVVAPTDVLPAGFEIDRGRVVFQRKPGGANDAEPVTVTVVVRGEPWTVQLATPDAVCGLEIVPREPEALEQDLGRDSYTGALYVASGRVVFSDAPDRVIEINGKDWLTLTPAERAAAADGSRLTPPLLTVPQWLTSPERSSVVRRYATLFEKEFEPNEAVDFSISPLVNDPTPQISELAVQCLALIGQYRPMVKALAQGPHEETRVAAIVGLRRWLPLAPENAALLREELGNVFHADDVLPVYRLLWGYGEEDARNLNTSQQLVDWLDHQHVAVRELAAYHIVRLTNRRYDYRATLAPAQRQLSVNRWRMHVQKEGSLLPRLPETEQ